MILIGVPLFMSEAIHLSGGSPFRYKMIFLFCAVTLHFTLHRKVIASGHRVRFRIRQAGSLFVADVLARCGSRRPRNRVSIESRRFPHSEETASQDFVFSAVLRAL
jgi:hypothetical protein